MVDSAVDRRDGCELFLRRAVYGEVAVDPCHINYSATTSVRSSLVEHSDKSEHAEWNLTDISCISNESDRIYH